MANLSEDKREHFRFPVYDDKIGVKLNRKNKRDFLKGFLDDGFIYEDEREAYENKIEIDPVDMIEEPDYFGSDKLLSQNDVVASPKRQSQFVSKTVTIESDRPKKGPDKGDVYVASSVETDASYQSPQAAFSNKFYEADHYGKAKHSKHIKNTFESSYNLPGEKNQTIFKPKHIPASLIDEDNRPKHTRELIVDELRRAASENLLVLESDNPTSLNGVESNPVSIEGVPSHHKPAINNKKKKNQRLDKSLSGIMADEANANMDHYYVD